MGKGERGVCEKWGPSRYLGVEGIPGSRPPVLSWSLWSTDLGRLKAGDCVALRALGESLVPCFTHRSICVGTLSCLMFDRNETSFLLPSAFLLLALSFSLTHQTLATFNPSSPSLHPVDPQSVATNTIQQNVLLCWECSLSAYLIHVAIEHWLRNWIL